MKRNILMILMAIFFLNSFSNKIYAQTKSDSSHYKQIIKYLNEKKYQVENSNGGLVTCDCVYPFLIKTNFVNVIGTDFQELKKTNTNSLTNYLENLDKQANAHYQRKNLKHFSFDKKKCNEIIFFSKLYNNMVYVEIIPYIHNTSNSSLEGYKDNYMGKVDCFSFSFKNDKIFTVKNGVYYAQ